MKSEWITCEGCEEEFRIVSDALQLPQFCPFCGTEIEHEDEDGEESDFD